MTQGVLERTANVFFVTEKLRILIFHLSSPSIDRTDFEFKEKSSVNPAD